MKLNRRRLFQTAAAVVATAALPKVAEAAPTVTAADLDDMRREIAEMQEWAAQRRWFLGGPVEPEEILADPERTAAWDRLRDAALGPERTEQALNGIPEDWPEEARQWARPNAGETWVMEEFPENSREHIDLATYGYSPHVDLASVITFEFEAQREWLRVGSLQGPQTQILIPRFRIRQPGDEWGAWETPQVTENGVPLTLEWPDPEAAR